MTGCDKCARADVPTNPVGQPQHDAGPWSELERGQLVPSRRVEARALEVQAQGRRRAGTEREAEFDAEGEACRAPRGAHGVRGGGEQRPDERRAPPPRRH
jgi:hypothetical protein